MKQIASLLLAATLLASCTNSSKKEEKKEDQIAKLKKERSDLDNKLKTLEAGKTDSTKKTPVTILTVQRSKFTAYIDLQAQIIGDENIYATPQAGGTVTGVLVHLGQRVAKGQLLATISAPDLEALIQNQQIQANLTKTLYEKQKQLWAQDIGTQVQLLQAKTNYERDLQTLQNNIAKRNYARIIAPIGGTIDQVDIKVGDVLAPGGIPAGASGAPGGGMRIVNNDKLKAQAKLGESYLGQVSIGAPVNLILPDINDSIQTKLTYVAQAVDPASRTFTAEVLLGSNGKLHPNMSCRMKIASYQNPNALVVPASVIQKTAQGDALYINAGGNAKSVKVIVGRISNGQAEILSGLNGGEQIITEGYQDLDDGQVVVPASN